MINDKKINDKIVRQNCKSKNIFCSAAIFLIFSLNN